MASIKYKDPETGKFVRVPMWAIGGLGEDANFVFNQDTASDTWKIKHDLNKLPSVTIINTAKEQIFGDITYDDENNVTIVFSAPVSGKATLN